MCNQFYLNSKMQANFIEVIRSFVSNDATIQRVAEQTLANLTKSSPNESIDLFISTLDFEDPLVNIFFLVRLIS